MGVERMKNWRKVMSSWTFEEMRGLQNSRLRDFLRHQVYPFSPYYRKLFDDNGIDVRSIETTDDLTRIPFTYKQDIAPDEEDPERPTRFVLAPNEETLRKYASKKTLLKLAYTKLVKGEKALTEMVEWEYAPVFIIFTTGRTAQPTPFLFTRYDFEVWNTHSSRSGTIMKEQINYEPGKLVLNAFPYAPHGGFWQVYLMTSMQGMLTLQSGGGKIMGTERILDALESGSCMSLVAVPGYLYHLLRKALAEGRDLSSLRFLMTGGERAHPDYREKVLQLARDCGAKDPKFLAAGGFTEQKHYPIECLGGENVGYHTWPDLDFFEIVDPETGERLPDDASGELTYTALDGRGSIVIRYRTGDMVRAPALDYGPCPTCGLRICRINSVISRRSEIKEMTLTKLKGTLVNLNLLYEVIPTIPEVSEWQVELRKKNNDPYDNDEIILYITPQAAGQELKLRSELTEKMKYAMEVAPTEIVFEPLDRLISRLKLEEELKEQRIVDNRPGA
jgi:phenylacetate-coenzyme A ligase PaaK-like adenylate-forming protein